MPSRRSSYPLSAATEAAARAMAVNSRDGADHHHNGDAELAEVDHASNVHQNGDADHAAAAIANMDGAYDGDVSLDGQPLAASISPPQLQLNEYREKLARDLERRELQARGLLPPAPVVDKIRVVAIQEESTPSPPWINANNLNTTSSTESGNTVRGAVTPAIIARTPSYPFPRMASTPGAFGAAHPFASMGSPASRLNIAMPPQEPRGVFEHVLSETSTPASTFSFNPGGTPMPDSFEYPCPDLYNMSLLLSSEPGLEAWWNTVVQIMRDVFQAERVTLSVPADAADLENVPWGQKATYNERQEDHLSVGYMAKGSSAVMSSDADATDTLPPLDDITSPGDVPNARPGLSSRHSFTSYEEKKDPVPVTPRRPNHLSRSKTSAPFPSKVLRSGTRLDKSKLEQHDAEVEDDPTIPSWEIPFLARYEGQGRVHSVLQALDFEADPLIDHAGVVRVLERGSAVTLTRCYPYLPPDNRADDASKMAAADSLKKARIHSSESLTKLSSILPTTTSTKTPGKNKQPNKEGSSRETDEKAKPQTPRYEEYEQIAASPWAQSPAPSPAVRSDTAENPFFADATVDEGSFDPASGAADYSEMPPPEAIGLDNSWTVIHIPLTHVLQSRQTRPFKLDATNMEQRLQGQKPDSPPSRASDSKKNKPAPIAILSILSTVTPYPSNLRKSLEHLAPHMATSFSLARHYTNLETELAGIQRRRPPTTGFGAVAPYGRSYESTAALAAADIMQLRSSAGSITSPSDYSAVSKSATGSPLGTPGWKRGPMPSPAAVAGGDSYFNSKSTVSSRPEALAPGLSRPKSSSMEISPGDKRSSRLTNSSIMYDTMEEYETSLDSHEDGIAVPRKPRSASSSEPLFELGESSLDEKTETERHSSHQHQHHHHPHTLLHSYGADFASTFQSLPPSSSLMSRPPPTPLISGPSRSMSVISSTAGDMPPPSDRLKSLILDSLPAHVFVSLPQTGEIVWVNSRYLSYRGQTVNDLAADPWKSLHPDDRDEYLKDWGHSLRTGDQFSRTVRIKRFDGAYRWFYARAVASKDKRGVIMQFLGSYMDIHDQHIAELKAARQEEIEASEAKHRLLANLIPQIIFTATEDDGVTFANEQWLSYTGQSFDDALGLGFMDFVHPEDLAKCRIPITRPPSEASLHQRNARRGSDSTSRSVRFGHRSSVTSSTYEMPTADLAELAKKGIVRISTDTNGRVSYTTELRLRSKNGEYRWHLIRCVEIDTIDFGRGASSYFGSATDINDHKLLEAKLKEAMESKGRFLSNMSHEIRTPLIGISGMVSFLQDTTLDEEQRDYTTTIQTSANSLIMIINDILDLSKADAGMMKLNFEWFRARSIMEDVNELVSTMAIGKGLELNYLVEADVPLWVKGDKIRIRQVLLNVVGNAIKFTETGEVFSRCKIHTQTNGHTGDNEIMLEFSITDTGRGFSKKEAELIFKPFSQIDGSSTRQHGGSGLGLVISRQLVELHGGKLEGTAVPGRGSTFTFTARFGLPTVDDQPNLPQSPGSTISTFSRQDSDGGFRGSPQLAATLKRRSTDDPSPGESVPASVLVRNGSPRTNPLPKPVVTPVTPVTPAAPAPRPLVGVNPGLARFSEAAKASGHDLSQMRLEIPSGRDSPGRTATPDQVGRPRPIGIAPPPVYSILIICPQHHSREATVQHIEMTLPKDVPHEIIAIGTIEEAHDLIGGDDPVTFSHIVINLGSAEAILAFLQEVTTFQKVDKTVIVILSDSVQRTAVMKAAAGTKTEQTLASNSVTFIYKPVKPSRFAVIFDPDKRRDLSTDWNRSNAQQLVEKQKASYNEMSMRMGHKGYKVLVVEDNKINQKVLTKYLEKIGVEVEIAEDGIECTELVFNKPHDYYSLILVCPLPHNYLLIRDKTNENSAIFKCRIKTGTRRAATFASGRRATALTSSP